jgi:hypothetical protein
MGNYRQGDVTFVNGVITVSYSSNIVRTDTSAKELFVLPPYSVIKDVIFYGPVSNAGTSARISLSSTGGGAGEFIANFNVKTNGVVSHPSSFDRLWAANDNNPIIVTGIYAEDGSASNTGGPYTVVVETIGNRS